jgi:hypothetical protein
MSRHRSIPLPAAPLLSPERSIDALSELMPMLDWVSQADILHHTGHAELAANCLTEALLTYRALPRQSAARDAFLVWLDRHSFRAEAMQHRPAIATIDGAIVEIDPWPST